MKKTFSLLVVLLFSTILSAQNIAVKSFSLLENDLTANTPGTIVYDQNGEKCSLIKIETTQTGFTFDVGFLGVVAVVEKPGEIWLYVPEKIHSITIAHPKLGILRDYEFGIQILKARTYLMQLTTGSVVTIVEEKLMKQYLMFRLEQKNAVVEVGGESWIPDANGECRKLLSFGSYDYRVKAKDYHDEVGKVTLDNADETKILQINLRPAYGWIEVKGSGDLSGAVVYVDDEMVGRVPLKTSKLSSGHHNVRIVKDLFRTYVENVVVEDNQTKLLSPTLIGEFSTVSITTKQGAEIWIDGERKGTTSWSGRLSFGEHLLETKLASHRTQSRVVNILPTEVTKSIQLLDPQPIYGSLSVEVLPNFADIYVDGVKVGQTPKLISKILVGEHKVEVRSEGRESLRKNITIREGELSNFEGELKNIVQPEVKQTANKVESFSINSGKNVENHFSQGAKNNVDVAVATKETTSLAYTYFSDGVKYEQVANDEFILTQAGRGSTLKMGEAAIKAYDCYLKANELDQLPDEKGKIKPKFTKKIAASMLNIYNKYILVNYGVEKYSAQEWVDALNAFETHTAILDLPFVAADNNVPAKDTTYYQFKYYAATCAWAGGMSDKAIAMFEEIKDKKYNENGIYQALCQLYSDTKNTVNYIATLEKGLAKFPKEFYYLGNLINHYVYGGQPQKATQLLDKAIANDPTNAQLYSVRGSMLEVLEDFDGAMANFNKAIELNSNLKDAWLGKARLIYNKAYKMEQKALEIRDFELSDREVAKAIDVYKESIPFFERVIKLDANDEETKKTLRSLYYKLAQKDSSYKAKYDAML